MDEPIVVDEPTRRTGPADGRGPGRRAPRPAAAQETGGPSYAQRHWTAEDGLPVNSVRDLAQGPQGYLWAATYVGLVRFDGRARAHR